MTIETRLFIDGQFVDAVDGATLDVINPFDGSVLAQVAEAKTADVDLAVAAATRAFPAWSRVPAAQRGAQGQRERAGPGASPGGGVQGGAGFGAGAHTRSVLFSTRPRCCASKEDVSRVWKGISATLPSSEDRHSGKRRRSSARWRAILRGGTR
jgi:hypothetical protein